jgi:hypothetical protein
MFCLDIETLSQKSDAVVLSLAILHFNETDKSSYEEFLSRTLFVKFIVKEQIENYNRSYAKDTIEWWKKQCDVVRKVSLNPSSDDIELASGIMLVRDYIRKHSDENDIVWTRGSLDQFCIDSVCEDSLKVPVLFHYNRYMDMRTAISLLKDTAKNGYCDLPDLDKNKVFKHDPRHDVVYDVMMLLNGV